MTHETDERPADYDLVILGAGSTAFAAALRAAEMGKRALMIEERVIGGTCANRGCLPSKRLIEAARALHETQHPRFAGIDPGEPSWSFAALIQQKDELVREYRQKRYVDVAAAAGLDIVSGHATFVSAHEVQVGERRIRGERFLIATGSRPAIPTLPGLDGAPYLTSDLLSADEAMEMIAAPSSLVIVGGGYIALELGQMFARFGVAVTILEPGPRPLWRVAEPEVGLIIRDILRAEGLTVLTRTQPTSVRATDTGVAISLMSRGEAREARADRLLVAAGRMPNSERLGLDLAGVRTAPDGAILVDEYLRTTAPHIWAAGDVIGDELESQQATPVGARDGAIAAHNALSPEEPRRANHHVIPRAIFTDPQIAMVGLTDAQARAQGRRCWCNAVPLTQVPRANVTGETHGMVKLVADVDTHEVLGVSMVGANAAEIIHEAAMGLRFHATLDDFIDLLHVYPTMSEALKIGAISYYKDPATLSCCAD